jgi:hypothetical protein
VGETDLWTTRPDVAVLLVNKDEGYKYGRGSHKKVYIICPKCGAILYKEIKTVCQQGLGCQYCSDHISYPNKFIREMLRQTDATNVSPEWSPDWIGRLRYDVYFEKDNKMYIIEMDGGLGHGRREIVSEDRLSGKEIDKIKDDEARKHNITLIRIDCDYIKISERFEYIKNNILCSELSAILDLKDIDWDECDKMSLSSYVVLSARLFNEGYSIKHISNLYNYCTKTIREWLYQAEKIGLCDCSVIHKPRHNSTKLTEEEQNDE